MSKHIAAYSSRPSLIGPGRGEISNPRHLFPRSAIFCCGLEIRSVEDKELCRDKSTGDTKVEFCEDGELRGGKMSVGVSSWLSPTLAVHCIQDPITNGMRKLLSRSR